jgi:hypothetical protein
MNPPPNPSDPDYNLILSKTIIGLPFVEGRSQGYCAYGAGKLIKLNGVDENRVNMYYSNDHGATWRNEYKNISSGGLMADYWNTYYLEDRFYAVGNNGQTIWSTNGTNWQSAAINANGKTAANIPSSQMGNRYTGEQTKAEIVAGNGYWLTFSQADLITRSQDKGVTWINSSALADKKHIAFGAGVFIIVCTNKIYTSTDGINWQLRFDLNDAAASFSNVGYGGGRFIATVRFTDARNTAFYHSVDNGSSWSLLSSLSKKIDIMAIRYGAGYWVAIMNWQSADLLSSSYNNGAAIISTNGGLTWSFSAMPYNYNYWWAGTVEPYWYDLVYIETATIKRFFAAGEVSYYEWGGGYEDVTVLPPPTPTPTRTPTPTPTATTPIPYSHTNLPPLTPGDRLLGSPTGTESGVFYRPNVQYSVNYPYPVPDQVVSGRTISVTVYGLPSGVSVVGTAAPVGQALKSGYPVLYIQGDALNGVTERFLIVYRNSYNGANYTTYIKGALRPI